VLSSEKCFCAHLYIRTSTQCSAAVAGSDCNPGIDFSAPGSGIKKFVIPGSRYWDH